MNERKRQEEGGKDDVRETKTVATDQGMISRITR
jgi:hypothetical protein